MSLREAGGEGGVSGYVNPYHQAWASHSQEDDGLRLVDDWGIANIVMGGNNVVDMFDFQHNQKQFPPNFFRKDPSTLTQRRFTCLVCNVSLFDEKLVRSHCVSKEHYNRLAEAKSKSSSVSIKKRSVDKRRLADVLEGNDEPAVGLENVVEWWPCDGDHRDQVFPVYTCQICDGFVGWGGDTSRHVAGEKHRRKQLMTRYPVLEEMIRDMEPAELKERAREEERKHTRRYDVIQEVTDVESYQEFYLKLEGKPFADTQQPPPDFDQQHHDRGPMSGGHHGHFSSPPPQFHGPPPGPPPHVRGQFSPRARGHYGPPLRGHPNMGPPPRGHPNMGPPPRGHHPHMGSPPPHMQGPPPTNIPPPMNVPPPMAFPPNHPPHNHHLSQQHHHRGHDGPPAHYRGRGRGHFRGGMGNTSDWNHDHDHPPPHHQGPPPHPNGPPIRGQFHQRGMPPQRHHQPHPHHSEDLNNQYQDYPRQGRRNEYNDYNRGFDQQDNSYGSSDYDEQYREPAERPKKRRVAPPEHMFDEEDRYRRPQEHDDYNRRPSEQDYGQYPPMREARRRPPTPPPRRGGRPPRREPRPPRPPRRHPREPRRIVNDDLPDQDLPEACYAVSADQEEIMDTENNAMEFPVVRNSEPRRRRRGGGRDVSEMFGVRTVGNIDRNRYYGPGGERPRKRKEPAKEEAPYEGPTIFDKVFKTMKKGDDEERGEKERDKEMELEWRKYKEETKARIRKEKEKLHRYEKKLRELEASTSSAELSLKEAEARADQRKASEAATSSNSESPRAASPPAAYGGRSTAYSSSESEGEEFSTSNPRLHESHEESKSPITAQEKFDPY